MCPPINKIPRKRLFVQVPYEDLLEKLWLVSLFKINCELYVKGQLIDLCKDADLSRIRMAFDKNKTLMRFHAPIYDPYKESFNIFRESYLSASRFCKRLRIDTIIMHVEYESKKFPSLEEWLKEIIGIWKWIGDSAKKDGITVLLENHNEQSCDPIVRILKEVDSEGLKACFDVGHFNAFGKKDVVLYLDDYPKGSIREFHLSDNLGDGDTHLALGKGNIDFSKFFEAVEARSIEAVYTIEASDAWGVIAGLRYLKRIGML